MHKKLLNEKKALNNKLVSDGINEYYYGIRGNGIVKINKWWFNNNFIDTNDPLSNEFTNYYFNYFSNNVNNLLVFNSKSFNFNSVNTFSVLNFNKLKFCSFNTNGAKRNINFIEFLMKNNDFIFIWETWLLEYESTNLLNSFSFSHTIFHKSDMNFTPAKGRQYGGRAFIVKKHLTIKNFNFINKHIASITLNHREKTFTFISVYLPFDNKSFLNLTEFQSCLQIVNELFLFYTLNRHLVFIIGDFNSDLTRNNRFYIFLKNFIDNNNLYASSPSMSKCEFSYQNVLYKAKLDHCLFN
jgi:hypothetical protein